MSRRFRICMAKGGRESARPSYGRPKLTLILSQKKKPKTVLQKTLRPQFSYFSLEIESAVFWYIRNIADSISRMKSENCGRKVFSNTYLFLLATRISPASPNFGQAKQGQKFVVPTFHIHFLNPECVTIPWVLAPKNFPIENFRVRSDLQKISLFHEFSCRFGKKNRRPAADSILMPPTFHIARLNRYTPNFSGVPQKLTWCQQFGLQIFPKWGDADICRLEMAVFRCFFGRNKFSRPNGRLSPIACLTYLESYGT